MDVIKRKMSKAYYWVDMLVDKLIALLQNKKALLGLIALVSTGFGGGIWTILDQAKEISSLRPIEVVKHVKTDSKPIIIPFDNSKNEKRLDNAESEIRKLKWWHE